MTMFKFKSMKQILLFAFVLCSLSVNAQFKADLQASSYTEPELNLPDPNDVRTGKVLEFISYPLFAGSGICAGLSNKLGQIDSPNSNRPEIYAVAASAGFVTSAGMWGVGISLQGKPKWSDLRKFAGAIAFSGIGFYTGRHMADIFKTK